MKSVDVKNLKLCAHCGGRPWAYELSYHETPYGCGSLYEIECTRCGIGTGRRHSLTAAVIIWNRRARRYCSYTDQITGEPLQECPTAWRPLGVPDPDPAKDPETPAGGRE